MKKSSTHLALIVGALLTTGCAGIGKGGYVPPEAVIPPAAEFSEAMLKFTEDFKKDILAKHSRSAREDAIRTILLRFLEGDDYSNADGRFDKLMPADRLLCEPYFRQARIAAPLESTAAKATAIKEIAKPPSDEWKSLLKSLGTNYTIDVADVEPPLKYDVWIASSAAGKACNEAVRKADPYITRAQLSQEINPLGGLTALKSLFDAVWGVVKPVVEGTLKNIDLERRNGAIRAFFSDAENVARLKSDISILEQFLEQEFAFERYRATGLAVVARNQLLDYNNAVWVNVRRDATACKQAIKARMEVKTDASGNQCLDKAFASLSPLIDRTLDAADSFDASLAKRLPEKRLSDEVDTMAAIAKGMIPAEDKAKAFWAVLVRYATLFDTIKEARSDDSRKKIDDALKAFREAIK